MARSFLGLFAIACRIRKIPIFKPDTRNGWKKLGKSMAGEVFSICPWKPSQAHSHTVMCLVCEINRKIYRKSAFAQKLQYRAVFFLHLVAGWTKRFYSERDAHTFMFQSFSVTSNSISCIQTREKAFTRLFSIFYKVHPTTSNSFMSHCNRNCAQ